MARRVEPPDSLDFFPTPPWAVRAFCDELARRGLIPSESWPARPSCWEPACGQGHMARALAEWFDPVVATDIHDYGCGQDAVEDFTGACFRTADWIVTNPPFAKAATFCRLAADRARVGAAMLVRTVFLEGEGRWRGLFRAGPPALVLQYVERVPMVKGRFDPDASTATSYAWFVWLRGHQGPTVLDWIAPARSRFERVGDARPAAEPFLARQEALL